MKGRVHASHQELLRRIVFVGGPEIRASIKIRCIQIAQFLGCDFVVNVSNISEIPPRKSIFICVKPDLTEEHLHYLSTEGTVIWDIHDVVPPKRNIGAYIVSCPGAYEVFRPIGQVYTIPHYHCNLAGEPNPSHMTRRPTWVGRPYWCPDFGSLDYVFYDTNTMSHAEVVSAYRNTGISLNLRAPKPDASFHVSINPGVKLLNAIGFGIPSISSREPAYLHYGTECTVFADIHECSEWVRRLQTDDTLYYRLHKLCLKRAPDFHIAKIVKMYLNMLDEIAQ